MQAQVATALRFLVGDLDRRLCFVANWELSAHRMKLRFVTCTCVGHVLVMISFRLALSPPLHKRKRANSIGSCASLAIAAVALVKSLVSIVSIVVLCNGNI